MARLAFSKLMKALESAKTFWSTTQLVQVNDEKTTTVNLECKLMKKGRREVSF